MKLRYVIVIAFIGLNVFSQSLETLESYLKKADIRDIDYIKLIAEQIFQIDKYNEVATYYLIQSYREYDFEDSVKHYFDNLIKNDIYNLKPYLLKAKFEIRTISQFDTTIFYPLKKALEIDSNNIEANYMLGISYYRFLKKYMIPDIDSITLIQYAVNGLQCLEKAYSLDSLSRFIIINPAFLLFASL